MNDIMDNIIDGRMIAKMIESDLKNKFRELIEKYNITPTLYVIIVGNNKSSEIYVKIKESACKRVGIDLKTHRFTEKTKEPELLKLIGDLNENKDIHGILIQLPLPKHIVNSNIIMNKIMPEKDVDGFTPINMGKILTNKNIKKDELIPATPKGVISLLDSCGVDLEGKHAVVIGRSNTVGRPLSILLEKRNATVTLCHSKTKDIEKFTKQADILISATGCPGLIKKGMVKDGAVIIDVGISKIDGKIKGDVDFDKVKEKARLITPVPGGVGPMTVVSLLDNMLIAVKKQLNK